MATNALKVYGSGAVADFMFSPEWQLCELASRVGAK